MMKKLLATITALALVVAMGTTTAFAAGTSTDVTTDDGTASIKVNAEYSSSATTQETISVKVEWEAMNFTYSVGGTKTWDASKHEYSTSYGTGSWSQTGNTITVTNHSNVDVKATFTFAKLDSIKDNINGSFSGTSTVGKKAITDGVVTLNKGEEHNPTGADKVVAALKLDGELSSTHAGQVGTVTVKIAKQ